jgi:sugar (pentulose or hexulose) kinase
MKALAVLDIGKTNAKLILFSQSGEILTQIRHAQEPCIKDGLKILDVDTLFQWLSTSIVILKKDYDITGLMVSTHGCGFALISNNRLAAPVLDYEQDVPDAVNQAFLSIAPSFAETFSPDLPGGLNFARHLFFRESLCPDSVKNADHILTYPQYWNWRLCGGLASEISFIGCHSHVWNPLAGDFSSLAKARGWASKFPPFQRAGAVLGTYEGIPVHNGVHDSNAAFYYYRSLGFENFTLISTGTWVIIFNPDCPLNRLDPARDMLANVTVDREPVATIRFMGGREYDVISKSGRTAVKRDALASVIAKRQMALPSFAAGGPFPHHKGRLEGAAPESESELNAIATLYVAAMTDVSLDLLNASKDIILDGGLAHNDALLGVLASLRKGQSIFANTEAEGTAMGAAALAFEAQGRTHVFKPHMAQVTPWDIDGLGDYIAEWKRRTA